MNTWMKKPCGSVWSVLRGAWRKTNHVGRINDDIKNSKAHSGCETIQ